MQQFLTRDYGETLDIIWEILADPASKPVEAMLAFGIIVIILAMVLIVVIKFVSRGAEDENEAGISPEAAASDEQHGPPSELPVRSRSVAVGRRGASTGLIIVGALLLWWLATGVMTAVPSVCESCHGDSAHVVTNTTDPHRATSCIRCHEAGGYVGVLSTGLPRRVAHIASGVLRNRQSASYGYVGNGSCAACHAADIAQTSTNDVKAVKVSHQEPIAAGAQCLDCHRLHDGVVGPYTTKMRPCLRCHNGTEAPVACSYCHTGDVALAIAGRSQLSTESAQVLVPNPDCGGCHSQESCDVCHGIRMPHTLEFKAYAHAREGVEDIWFNGGATCGKCHNSDNRPCTECHGARFPSHGLGFSSLHGAGGGTGASCDSCHGEMAYRSGRDFCVDLCHTTQAL